MRRLFLTLILALLVSPAGAGELRDFSSRTFDRTLEFGDLDGPPRLLVDNVWGDVRVEGVEGDRVLLVAVETIRAESEAAAARAAAEVDLLIDAGAGRVDVVVDGPFRDRSEGRWGGWHRDPGYVVSYDFQLRVPRRCDLDLRTVTDGEVTISGVRGDLQVRNVNGGIRLLGTAALSGRVETVNGPIVGIFDEGPIRELGFRTVNGRIDVTFPPSLAADLQLASRWGEIWSEYQVASLPAPPPTRRTEKGRLVIEVGHGAAVRVGAGGPTLSFETLNGDIYIRKEGRTR